MTATAVVAPHHLRPNQRWGISPATIVAARSVRRRSQRLAARRRRRLLAVAAMLGLGVAAGHAGVALGGSSLATPERSPHVRTDVVAHVVEPGDTLWSIAADLAPERDPRAVVDAIVEARGSSMIQPGETITWLARG